ncbi:MAG: RPA family protein [Halobacteriota archaeon]
MSTVAREVAVRVFAGELRDAEHKYKEGDDERSPAYVLLPTGDRANRVFVVGTMTEKEDIGEDSEYWRARVVDPTGTFLVYAGQYQAEALDSLREIEPPEYVAVVGKPDTYEPEEGEVITSIRPESINAVDADVRDRWIAETAERTIERIESGPLKDRAREQYGREPGDYRDVVVEAVKSLED